MCEFHYINVLCPRKHYTLCFMYKHFAGFSTSSKIRSFIKIPSRKVLHKSSKRQCWVSRSQEMVQRLAGVKYLSRKGSTNHRKNDTLVSSGRHVAKIWSPRVPSQARPHPGTSKASRPLRAGTDKPWFRHINIYSIIKIIKNKRRISSYWASGPTAFQAKGLRAWPTGLA